MSPEHPATQPGHCTSLPRGAVQALRHPVFVVAAVSALAIGLTLAGVSRAFSADRVEQAARERGGDAVQTVQEMRQPLDRLTAVPYPHLTLPTILPA